MPIIPGSVCWAARLSGELDPVASFYEAVMGWTTSPVVVVDTDYRIAHAGPPGQFSAQIGLDAGTVAALSPPGWMPHLLIEDAGEIVARIAQIPAAELLLEREIPHLGQLVVVRDPGGLIIALWAPSDGSPGHPGNTDWKAVPYSEIWTPQPAATAEFIAAVVRPQVTRVGDDDPTRERWIVEVDGAPAIVIRDNGLVSGLSGPVWVPFLACPAVAPCLTTAIANGGQALALHPPVPEAGTLRLGWCRDGEGVPVGFAARH